jgi:hypothetical protein
MTATNNSSPSHCMELQQTRAEQAAAAGPYGAGAKPFRLGHHHDHRPLERAEVLDVIQSALDLINDDDFLFDDSSSADWQQQ